MIPTALFALLAATASLTACAYPDHNAPDVGNLNHFAYAGEPGSAYDRAANPPRDIGQVAYDPNQPLALNLPANDPQPPIPPSETTAPVVSTPLNPAVR